MPKFHRATYHIYRIAFAVFVVAMFANNQLQAAPDIREQPQNLTCIEGDGMGVSDYYTGPFHTTTYRPVQFSVIAVGSGSLSYRWQKNGEDIVLTTANPDPYAALSGTGSIIIWNGRNLYHYSATNSGLAHTLAINDCTMADSGTYRVIVKDASGQEAVSNAAILTVNKHAPPVIDRQPQDTTVIEGDGNNIMLTTSIKTTGSTNAYGDYCLFEWYKNDALVKSDLAPFIISSSGAFYIKQPDPSHSGKYSVTVKDRWGGVTTSATAQLTVQPSPTAPVVIAHPADVTVTLDREGTGSVSFAVSATYAMNYQWLKDGVPLVASDRNKTAEDRNNILYYNGKLPGPVERASLSISNLRAGDAGQYSVMIWNSTGTTTSQPATLAITHSPTAISGTQAVALGRDITLSTTNPPGAQTPVQWQVSTNGGQTWQNITNDATYSGATAQTLNISGATASMDSYQYRYSASSQGPVAYSAPITLAVSQNFFPHPAGLAYYSGILFVADDTLHTIQAIELSTGQTRTVAGKANQAGSSDGTGEAARFNQPRGISMNSQGTLFVADAGNGLVRAITPDGKVTTLAGSPTARGSADGSGSNATFTNPAALWADPTDDSAEIRIIDTQAHTLRHLGENRAVTTLAGAAGVPGYIDADDTRARFNHPSGLVRLYQNEYIFYRENNLWGHLFGGSISASNGMYYQNPVFIKNATYIADSYNHTIRVCVETTESGVTQYTVRTLAGLAGISGSDDGTGADSRFKEPGGMTMDTNDNMYVADTGNSTIRLIKAPAETYTIAGLPGITGHKDGAGYDAWFNHPTALTLGPGVLYIADTGNSSIRQYDLYTGQVTTLRVKAVAAASGTNPNNGQSNGTPGQTNDGGGGGGGGMPSIIYLALLGIVVSLRRCMRRRAD